MYKTFLIKVENEYLKDLYTNHSSYHEGDSGLDLFAPETVTIGPGETYKLDLGIKCQSRSVTGCLWKMIRGKFWKYNSYLLLPRSSISKTPLLMRNSIGLIDSGYTGNLAAPLFNTSNQPYTIQRGERLVQLVNYDLSGVKFVLTDTLRDTSRGEGGFGSTGK